MIAIICIHPKIAESWRIIFAEAYGEDQVQIYPEISDYDKVKIALVWKPGRSLLERFPNLQFIQSLGAGVDHIFDSENAIPGTQIARIVDPRLSEDMWEFTTAIILNDMKRLPVYGDQQRDAVWKAKKYRSIPDVKVGVLGLGAIGAHVAHKLSMLGFETHGWARSQKEIKGVQCVIGEEGLNKMLAKVDYLVNILPLTSATRGFLNASLFDRMKKGSHLINVGRGPHLVDEDLIIALDKGQLSGASLDVFHQEPLEKEHPFWDHPKIVLTPHIASITNLDTARDQMFENIRRFKNGEALLNEVSLEKGY